MNVSVIIFLLSIVLFAFSIFIFDKKTKKLLTATLGVVVFIIPLYASVNWDY